MGLFSLNGSSKRRNCGCRTEPRNDEAEQIAKLEEEVEALRTKLSEQASGLADTSRAPREKERKVQCAPCAPCAMRAHVHYAGRMSDS